MSSTNHNMEPKLVSAVSNSGFLHRLLPVVGPALLISVGYVDPGKWAATIEGGARFGFSLVAPMLFFNLTAVLCQYLSACVGVVTGKDLAKICSDEYDACTCMLLGVQTVVSMVALDLSMLLGIAHGLNLLFGVELSTCVLITAVDAVLFPLFAAFLERRKANFLCACIAGLILLLYILGVLVSQPETPLSLGGLPTKFEESAYTMMSLLGASILPHNLFLHSSIVLQHRGQPNASKEALCQKHFFAITCIFSGIYLVNHVLMNSAANVFYNTGLVLLTFSDAMSLMEQVLRSPVAPFGFLLIVCFANQIMALTWNYGGNIVMHDFLHLDLPNWLQRATIRIAAIVPALYCVWTSGVEGVYQLLIFTQVVVAILLPSSVIPLFRVASSSHIMGVHKISQFFEFLALITCLGMLGIKTIFVVEMIFGDSDWVGNLRWNMGSSSSVPYIVLLVTSCLSFCLMLWLAATPLKSATHLGAQMLNWDVQNAIPEPVVHREENLLTQREHVQSDEEREVNDTISDTAFPDAADYGLPEKIMALDQEFQLPATVENCSDGVFPSPSSCIKEDSLSSKRSMSNFNEASESADSSLTNAKTVRDESVEPIEKTVSIEGDLHNERDEDEGDSWEPEESSRAVPGSTSSIISDGPGSFRSVSGKSEDGGNGTGSLSRLAGLGRAARRQLAAILDEFWGQLYNFYGQPTQEAKFKKLDILLGDSKPASSLLKVETTGKEFGGYYHSISSRGPDSLINSAWCDSPKQPRMQSSIDPSYGAQRGSSSSWSNRVQLLDAYVQASNANAVDSSKRRYSSMRSLPTSNSWDYQPNTVHGYQIASLVNRYAKDRALLNGQMDSSTPLSLSMGLRNYRDPMAIAMAQKLQNGLSSPQASQYQSLVASRISSLQTENPYQNVNPSGSADSTVMSTNAKKYHSLPDISGLSVSYTNLYASEMGSQWDKPVGFGATACRTSYDSSFYSNSGPWSGGHLNFDELSKGYGDTSFNVASDHDSLWSKQPYEQFGVAEKSRALGSKLGSRSSSNAQESISHVESESQLLQSFRCCILKLLKLEGSDWLFRQNDGADEDLIDSVAARERCLYEAETREMTRAGHLGEPQYLYSDRKPGLTSKNDDASFASFLVSSVPNCGDGCVYKADLVVSFGVWCIHRILDLSLMENRPELWGKYTFVLNRLQGIIDPAFAKPHTPMSPCFCLQLSAAQLQRSSPPVANGMLPPPSKPGRGKCTTAPMLLDLIKVVENTISGKKGRSGTAAGDVAFPKGKENIASVLKRYKRWLTNKPVGSK